MAPWGSEHHSHLEQLDRAADGEPEGLKFPEKTNNTEQSEQMHTLTEWTVGPTSVSNPPPQRSPKTPPTCAAKAIIQVPFWGSGSSMVSATHFSPHVVGGGGLLQLSGQRSEFAASVPACGSVCKWEFSPSPSLSFPQSFSPPHLPPHPTAKTLACLVRLYNVLHARLPIHKHITCLHMFKLQLVSLKWDRIVCISLCGQNRESWLLNTRGGVTTMLLGRQERGLVTDPMRVEPQVTLKCQSR